MSTADDAGVVPSDAAHHSAVLQRLRRRLLDLTANNTLLNYRHPKSSSLRIVDEVPAQVFERLVDNGHFSFAPLSEPPEERRGSGGPESHEQLLLDASHDPRARASAERRASQARREARRLQRAAELGVNPSFDLPKVAISRQVSHQDSKLQTLLFPEELEEQLRKMQRTATTSEEETGANRLHLLCGFIEWSEAGYGTEERVTRLAPLVVVPVRLQRRDVDRATNTYRYTLERTGEDWSANVTLQEKCRVDFGFVLPDVEDDDDSLEHYFGRVEQLMRGAQPTWRLRRCLTLGLVSFGKVLMWRDLDPAKWPSHRSIFGSAPLRDLLGASRTLDHDGAAQRAGGTGEYPIDRLEEGPGLVPPTIIEADSSQHSAMIDVERGVNMVLQGPPGTGKSQTITNLIAAAIKHGRRVLFVAEKKAALDVVLTRLRAAGLTDFCLSLHSHSSAKREFISDLAQRLALRDHPPSEPRELEPLTNRLLQARDTLSLPLDALHTVFSAVEMTPYEIFWRARRLSVTVSNEVLAAIEELHLPQVTRATPQMVAGRRDLVDDFAGAFGKVRAEGTTLDRHPWSGITSESLLNDDVDDLLDAAHAWRAALADLEAEAAKVDATVGAPFVHALQDLLKIADRVPTLNASAGRVPDDLPHLVLSSCNVPEVRSAVDAVWESRDRWRTVEGAWNKPGVLPREQAGAFATALAEAASHFGPMEEVRTIRDVAETAKRLGELLDVADRTVATVLDALGGDAARHAAAVTDGAGQLSAVATATLVALIRDTIALEPAAVELLHGGSRDAQARARIEAMMPRASDLLMTRAALGERFQPSFRSSISDLRETATALATAPRLLPSLLSGAYRQAARVYRAMSGGVAPPREVMVRDVRSLVTHHDAVEAFSLEPVLHDVFGRHVRGIDSPFYAALSAADWHTTVRVSILTLGRAGRDLAAFVTAVTPAQWQEAAERVGSLPQDWDTTLQLSEVVSASIQWSRMPAGIADEVTLPVLRQSLSDLQARCDALLSVVSSAGADNTVNLASLSERFARVRHSWEADDAVAACAAVLARLHVSEAGSATDVAPVEAALTYIGNVRDAELPEVIEGWLLGPGAPKRVAALTAHAERLGALVAQCRRAVDPLLQRGGLEAASWIAAVETDPVANVPATLDAVPLGLHLRRLNLALGRESALRSWAVYRRSRAKSIADGLQEIVGLVEAERLTRDNAGDAYEAAFYRNLASAALRQVEVLDTFDSGVHTEVCQRFSRLDGEREVLMRRAIAAQLARTPSVGGCSGPRVAEMTDEPLIRHQAGLQRRQLAIRELFRRAGRAIQSIKPCFLMGPQAVAQYLPPGEFEFDLVVMDEASQLRPEDALGAIARGRQVLIVGDPMQLGPTRFFDRMDAGEDDLVLDEPTEVDEEESSVAEVDVSDRRSDGATVLERSESILLAAASCFPVRMLRWHYRSRHPRLIAFSNREFYHERLIVFPTPGDDGNGHGVTLHQVKGTYASRRNVLEAQAVVEAVQCHSREWPHRTLLVATLNAEQADLIDDFIERAEKEDPVLGDFRARHAGTQEPFAIKSLENVQGDERDRIMVSVTFGPNDGGQLRQNFGPINQAGGERRLNVLLTRAKYRLDVFCSFDPNALRVSESTSPRGLRVLRDYLRYANGEVWWARGTETGREPDSDFEVAVATALRARGYDARAQVGVAGYFIDLAVVDPDAPGRFLLGVECDGATYHSAKTARDRDRLRQKQLESLGWTLHRIWSTDWFKDPDGQMQSLVRRVEQLRQSSGESVEAD
jgi:very-short-patch-repair endonuclease